MYSHMKSFCKRKDFFFFPGKRRYVFHKSFSLSDAETYIWGFTSTDKSPCRKHNPVLRVIVLSECLDTGSGFHLE